VGAVARQEGKDYHWRIRSGALALLINVARCVRYGSLEGRPVSTFCIIVSVMLCSLQVVIARNMIFRSQLLDVPSLALLRALLGAGDDEMKASRTPDTRPDDTIAAVCRDG